MTFPMMTRRGALIAGGAMLLAGSAGALTVSRQAGDRKFVLVILRGALDGLAAVAPYGDSYYRAVRGGLALPSAGDVGGVLPLADGFGLHPNLAFLHEQWKGGELAILPACASPYRERSHFDAQDVLETGAAEVFGASDGWLGRALTALPPELKRDAVAISGSLPLVLRGSASATSWAPSLGPSASDDTLSRLMDLYAGDALLGPALASAIATNSIASASGLEGMEGKGRRGGPGPIKASRTQRRGFCLPKVGPPLPYCPLTDGIHTPTRAPRMASLRCALRDWIRPCALSGRGWVRTGRKRWWRWSRNLAAQWPKTERAVPIMARAAQRSCWAARCRAGSLAATGRDSRPGPFSRAATLRRQMTSGRSS